MSHVGHPCVIVKIGGSLSREAAPRGLLNGLADHAGLVVVPGGGALADGVRDAQPRWGLSDRASHAMAILAMEQMAHAFHDLAPRLVPVHTDAELRAPRRNAALWFPARMLIGDETIAANWDVTSDSLALWLARSLAAPRLVLVKAAEVPVPATPLTSPAEIEALARTGVVDGAFPALARGYGGTIFVVNADDSRRLDETLGQNAVMDRPMDHP